MVALDHALIYNAQRATTGANVHQIGTLLFCYQQAVVLHNSGFKDHHKYHRHYEDLLRQYLAAALPAVLLQERTQALKEQAKLLMERSHELIRESTVVGDQRKTRHKNGAGMIAVSVFCECGLQEVPASLLVWCEAIFALA